MSDIVSFRYGDFVSDIAGYAAESGGKLYGYGDSMLAARRAVQGQIAGAPPGVQQRILITMCYRALSADEASDVLEMLDTPWVTF